MAKRNKNTGLKNLSLTDLVNMIGKETAQNIFTGEINKIKKLNNFRLLNFIVLFYILLYIRF